MLDGPTGRSGQCQSTKKVGPKSHFFRIDGRDKILPHQRRTGAQNTPPSAEFRGAPASFCTNAYMSNLVSRGRTPSRPDGNRSVPSTAAKAVLPLQSSTADRRCACSEPFKFGKRLRPKRLSRLTIGIRRQTVKPQQFPSPGMQSPRYPRRRGQVMPAPATSGERVNGVYRPDSICHQAESQTGSYPIRA